MLAANCDFVFFVEDEAHQLLGRAVFLDFRQRVTADKIGVQFDRPAHTRFIRIDSLVVLLAGEIALFQAQHAGGGQKTHELQTIVLAGLHDCFIHAGAVFGCNKEFKAELTRKPVREAITS